MRFDFLDAMFSRLNLLEIFFIHLQEWDRRLKKELIEKGNERLWPVSYFFFATER